MKISCLMPTYNRATDNMRMLEESIECFLRQDYPERELIVLNDTPGQRLTCEAPGVRIINLDERLPDLSAKIQYMIEVSCGDLLCRWDDDDISLPHRLSYCAAKLAQYPEALEYRTTNYWFNPVHDIARPLHHVNGAANTHIMSLWRREILCAMPGGVYPPKYSGYEDQAFNRAADDIGRTISEQIPLSEIHYLYRWGCSAVHLSGRGGPPEQLQAYYDELGTRQIEPGSFAITPRWQHDYTAMATAASGS